MPTISDEVRETPDLIFSEEETKAMKSPKRRACSDFSYCFLKRTLTGILLHGRKRVGTASQIKLSTSFNTLVFI